MGPPVQSSRSRHGAAQICHGQTNDKDTTARQKPGPDHSRRPGRKREGQRAGDGREEAHDGEGYAEDFECRKVALEFLLVAHLGQELCVRFTGEYNAAIAGRHEIWVVVVMFGWYAIGGGNLFCSRHCASPPQTGSSGCADMLLCYSMSISKSYASGQRIIRIVDVELLQQQLGVTSC